MVLLGALSANPDFETPFLEQCFDVSLTLCFLCYMSKDSLATDYNILCEHSSIPIGPTTAVFLVEPVLEL